MTIRAELAKCRYIVYTYIMTTKVQKWGNSYAIRIPKYIVEELGLTAGSLVDIKRVNDTIVIRPISKKKNMKRFVL